ncbi:MAG: type II toxin-antitoxin system Phd/YefM family antitoxin [bacterium]
MKATWALQDAKNRFSEVVDKTLREGPQSVTRRGVPVVMIIPQALYAEQNEPADSFVSYFRKSPLCGVEWDIPRSRDTGREVNL